MMWRYNCSQGNRRLRRFVRRFCSILDFFGDTYSDSAKRSDGDSLFWS